MVFSFLSFFWGITFFLCYLLVLLYSSPSKKRYFLLYEIKTSKFCSNLIFHVACSFSFLAFFKLLKIQTQTYTNINTCTYTSIQVHTSYRCVFFFNWKAFSPDGRWLISASMDCSVRTWDLPSGWWVFKSLTSIRRFLNHCLFLLVVNGLWAFKNMNIFGNFSNLVFYF